MTCACGECFDYGDVVEHKMNASIFGIIIAFSGSLVTIRTAPHLATLTFQEFELQHRDEFEDAPAAQQEDLPDNVIKVDFRGRSPKGDTKTEGAA